MLRFGKRVNGYLTVFTTHSILDVWQGSEYASGSRNLENFQENICSVRNKKKYLSTKSNNCKGIYYSSQPAIACSKLTIETVEQGVKYVQS